MNTKPLHIVIDIETLGTKPGCAIVSIGAVAFRDLEDLRNAQHHEPWSSNPMQFYARVRWQPGDHGAIDPSTVDWWLTQGRKARAELTSSNRESRWEVLARLHEWLNVVTVDQPEGVYYWSQGDFDFPILNEAFKIQAVRIPWKYWRCMDLRTLRKVMELFPHPALSPQKQTPRPIAHHAYWDAYTQALELQQILTHLDLNLATSRISEIQLE